MAAPPRLAVPDDLPAVRAIVEGAYRPYAARIGREPAPMGADYAALVAAGRVHVAERGGAVRGLIVLIPEGDTLLVENVAVAPAAQGTGVGRALMAHAEDLARRAGRRAVRLYTNEAMAENVALYARLGFRETRRAEEDGFRRIHMAKPLG